MNSHYQEDPVRSLFRPELETFPPVALPVYPRSTGYFCRRKGEEEIVLPGVKNFVQIFWCVAGEGRMFTEQGNFLIREGDFFYRLPLQEHHFLALSEHWRYRWIAFDGAGAETFMRTYQYPAAPYPAGQCPVEYFENFKNLLYLRTPYSWRMMFAEICRILAAAGGNWEPSTPDNRLIRQALDLCRMRFAEPDWNVNALAAALQVGRTTLNAVFREKMNLTPSAYLGQIRLQEALSLLRSTRRPLREIAAECGFDDVNYFCRFLKRNTGKRPAELR